MSRPKIEIYPEKLGRPVNTRSCRECRSRWGQLTSRERVVVARNGGAKRFYEVQCTNCGYDWWSSLQAVRAEAETDRYDAAVARANPLDASKYAIVRSPEEAVELARKEGRRVVNAFPPIVR